MQYNTQKPTDKSQFCPHCQHVDSPSQSGWDLEHQYWHRNRENCPITRQIFQKAFDRYKLTGRYTHPWHFLHQVPKLYHYHITFTVDDKKYPHGTQFNYIKTLLKRLSQSKIFSWKTNQYQFCIEHITTNCHVHLYVAEKNYIRCQPLTNLNRKMGVKFIPLKTSVYIENTKAYINKEEPDKIIPDSIFEISLKTNAPIKEV